MHPDAEPLRVIVNGIPMIPPRTGIGRFVHANAEAMARLAPSIRASFFYGFRLGGIEDSSRPRNWIRRLSRLPGTRSVSGRILAHRIRGAAFRCLAPRGRFDLYHETNYAPFPFRGPTLCTIYDLSFLLLPETHPEDRVRLMSRRVRAAATSASRFVTISESVRREMTEHLGISAPRIDVIRPACDPAFLAARPADLEQRIRALGLPPAYLLAVGTVEPRKNLDTLLRALRILKDRRAACPPLVVAGPPGWKSDPTFALVDALGLRDAVRFAGFLPDADLAVAYAGASLFVSASLYEGFGIPPLEALAAGTPVLLSDIPAHREIYPSCAGFVPPSEPEAWAGAIAEHLRNPSALAALAAGGRALAESLTWERSAALLAESYRRTARG